MNLFRTIKRYNSVARVFAVNSTCSSAAISSLSSGLLQTAQTWANAGVCGGLCACAVGGTFD